MPDKELIHVTSDLTAALLFALDGGLQVRVDEPQLVPRPRLLERSEVGTFTKGVFFLFRPEWVHGPFQILPISAGHNQGKYTVSPGINVPGLTLYFGGESIDQGRRRLGTGAVSFNQEWLELPTKAIRRAPPEIGQWWKRILSHILSGASIKVGAHRYELCRAAADDPNLLQCLPPFDFIPWNREVIQRPKNGPKIQ